MGAGKEGSPRRIEPRQNVATEASTRCMGLWRRVEAGGDTAQGSARGGRREAGGRGRREAAACDSFASHQDQIKPQWNF